MIPSSKNSDYPKFVPNQVLTSDNLNDLFGYLDEQGRITRTNLAGIGIACGLNIKLTVFAAAKAITLTKGTGITSEGYLVTLPETTYMHYINFDAVKPEYYDRFVKTSDKTPKMPLWELKQAGEVEDPDNPFRPLVDPSNFLNDKVVLIFVELLETRNKNCDPDSCDDKGVLVTVNPRVLLIRKADVDTYISNEGNKPVASEAISLPELKMPRVDVTSTVLYNTRQLFRAYTKVLNEQFIQQLNTQLSFLYNVLDPIVHEEFSTDPFSNFKNRFSFLYDGSLTRNQALNLQYYYDFFSDLIAAYEELRGKASELVCTCVPDSSLFPRHLLAGEATGVNEENSQYRNHFIRAGAQCCCDQDAEEVRFLFRRLVLLDVNFLPEPLEGYAHSNKNNPVKATPSVLGSACLSEKAIPIYYEPNSGSYPLYKAWNFRKTRRNSAQRILSYNSGKYNTADDIVINPLKYDLESGNFLRIEGHLGKDYRQALAEADALRKDYRLPVDVIAVGSETLDVLKIFFAMGNMNSLEGLGAGLAALLKHPACFSDVLLALDQWISNFRCCLAGLRNYFYALPSYKAVSIGGNLRMAAVAGVAGNDPPQNGVTIGELYEVMKKEGKLNKQSCNDVLARIALNEEHVATALVMMPYKIDNLLAVIPDDITKFDASGLQAGFTDLKSTAGQLKTLYASPNAGGMMAAINVGELQQNLNMNCLVCLIDELLLLVKEFLARLLGLAIRQKLGYYAHVNPGIQHKAGVPYGGTFVMVYHETQKDSYQDLFNRYYAMAGKTVAAGKPAAQVMYAQNKFFLSAFLLLDEALFLENLLTAGDTPDELLDPIVQSIEPGRVVADFYLPYLCAGSCPATQLMVLPLPGKANQPPVARAGDSITIQLPDNQVTLDGSSSSDPDGTISAYLWSQDSGPGNALIGNPESAVTLVSGLVEGEYVFRLKVTDNQGATGEDTVKVKVLEISNVPPVAVATAEPPLVYYEKGASTRLHGESSYDPDGSIVKYEWTNTGGPASGFRIDAPTGNSTVVEFYETGQYTFNLMVTDNRGATGSASVSVLVIEAQNRPPVADAGEDTQYIFDKPDGFFRLDGSKSYDPDGDPLTYVWVRIAGPGNPVIVTPTQAITEVRNFQNGKYTFQLTVKDDKGALGQDTVNIDVILKYNTEKNCGPLSDILEQFSSWQKIADKNPAFKDLFNYYNELLAYFKQLIEIAKLPVEEQIKFFLESQTEALLLKWLGRLQYLISNREDVRFVSLELYRILNLLAMYIACIQTEDIDKAVVPMIKVFELISRHVQEWTKLAAQGAFSQEDMGVIQKMVADIEREVQRTNENGEANSKAHYLALLNRILKVLKTIH